MAARARPSLEEILGDTPSEKLDQPCQDEHLCKIACEITDWSALAPFMGVSRAEEEEIEGRWPKSIKRQKIELLRKWKQKHRGKNRRGKRKDTYRSLCKVFMNAQLASLVNKVCDILCDDLNSSDGTSDDSDDYFDALEDLPLLMSGEGSEAPTDSAPKCKPKQAPLANLTKDDPAFEPLADHLRKMYKGQNFIVDQWPPPPTLEVFNLAMIVSKECDVIRRRPPDEELTRLTVRGNVDDIMGRKTSIKVEELFDGSSKRRKFVLLEGAPGAGKSTLAWHICQKWEAQELFLQEFKLVIYVQCRDTEAQQAKEIADLLQMELKSERKDATSLIRACHGEGVLFVLDGWDEFSPGLQRDSLFEKLICRPEKLSVQCSTVLITSRPIASKPLQKHATSRVEIVGFTANEVGRYFKDVFKDTQTLQKLHSHLNDRPRIKASCYLPLNAAIVAHLFIEQNHTLPTTLHDVFSSLVFSCINRHLTKGTEIEPVIASLEDLPPDVEKVFLKLCLLAYEGTMENKVIFSGQDLRSYGLPEELNVLSLMQVVKSFATGKPTCYHFLHLSIQELLAALHISKLPPTEQVEIFNELFGEPRFEAVFGFYAAFTKLQAEGVRDIVTRIVQTTQITDTESYDYEGQRRPLLNLLHCLYEAQDTAVCHFICSLLQGALDLSGITLSPLEILSLKYFLSCVNVSSPGPTGSSASPRPVTELNLSYCGLEHIDSLSMDKIVKLSLSGNCISSMCAAQLLTRSPQLNVIKLIDCELTDDGVEAFVDALRTHPSLFFLDLSLNYGLSMHGASQILKALQNHPSLQCLDLHNCCLDMKSVADVLEVNQSLRRLRIGGGTRKWQGITYRDLVTLASGLKKNTTLKKLVVEFSPQDLCTNKHVKDFVWSLRECHLKTLTTDRELTSALRRQRDRVNEMRGRQGLPRLKLEHRNPDYDPDLPIGTSYFTG